MSSTTEKMSRRELLRLATLLAVFPPKLTAADRVTGGLARKRSNFRLVYASPEKENEFHPFLQNVFHLFPEEDFRKLILEVVKNGNNDPEIYNEVLRRVPEIKPWFSEVTYALPALWAQKGEMKRQTVALLGERRKIDGYMEVGSPARYLSALRKEVEMTGPAWILNDYEPGYNFVDIFERGQLMKLGTYLPLGNYEPVSSAFVPKESLDLITVYIGFHHCPETMKKGFIQSLYGCLRKGGVLILRDHDVADENMDVLVGLAHDVFNAGLVIPWDETSRQIRNFQSVSAITAELTEHGFRREGDALYQQGDPTRNALMRFVK